MFFQNRPILANSLRAFTFFISLAVFHFDVRSQSQPIRNLSPLQNASGNNASFRAMQQSMDEYWKSQNVTDGFVVENGTKKKVPNWKLFKRWEYYWEQRADVQSGEFPRTNSAIEFEKYRQQRSALKKTATFNESWSNLGTNSSDGGYAGIGRINCIAFHPTDNSTYWVGSASGGIWKTIDDGSTWTNLNDNQTVLGVSDIAVPSDYATSNTLYIATGDRDGGSMWSLGGGQVADNASIGVLKSVDGGATWTTTGLTYTASNSKKIYSLLVHPTNTSILFASTTDGVYKSTDGGTSWVQKSIYRLWRMAFKPGDPTVMYGTETYTGNQYFDKSTNTGETWVDGLYGSGTNARRTELAVSPSNPNIIYLLACNNAGGLNGIYKSSNSGTSFTRVDDGTKSMLYYYSDGSGTNSGQGTYDLTITCSPTDSNTVYIGGVNTWKSTNGGSTWTINNMWTSYSGYNISGAPEVHADKHILAFQDNTTLFEGNDGGIYKTTDGGSTWTDKTNGIVISQIYRLGVSQTDANVVLAGLQDNGSKKYTGGLNTWVDVTGGDGMECIVDFNNATTYMYATYVRGTIYRNSNGFSTTSTTTISANIPGGQPVGAWVTPYIMDPTNSAVLYAGYDSVWKTTNRGDSWTGISQQLSDVTKLRSLAVAPSNTNVLYAADQTNMWKTTDGGATNWTSVTLPSVSNSVTYIAVKNTDANTLWITYGGYTDGSKVYESVDGGATWTNISSGLPNLPVMCIVHYTDITNRHVLFAGTDVGVYVKDGANAWASYNTGLPNVVVTELEIFYTGTTDRLRAATFGRGLWETEISSPLPVELSSFTASVVDNAVLLRWETATEVNNHGFEIERRVVGQAFLPVSQTRMSDLPWEKISFVKGNGTTNAPNEYSYIDRYISAGKYSYRLKQIDRDGKFEYSQHVEISVAPNVFALEQNYPNPFNPSTEIHFSLPVRGLVSLKVFDILGKEIASLVNEVKEVGVFTAEFSARNIPSGVYFYTLRAGNFTATKKMVVLK